MNWKAMLIPLASVPIILLLAFGLTRDPNLTPSPLEGRLAPPFALETLQGDTFRLTDVAGQPVMVNFWATWCIPCLEEHPLLMDISERYRDRGLKVIGVVYQDTRANAIRWYQQRGGDWTNVLDPGSRVAIEYGVRGVPETYFITPDGHITHRAWVLRADSLDIWLNSIFPPTTSGNAATHGG